MRRRTAFAAAAVAVIVFLLLARQAAEPRAEVDPGTTSGVAASAVAQASEGRRPDAAGWVDANGAPVMTAVIEEFPGPEHCGWESTTWLRFRGVLYLRDPRGLLRASTIVGFDPDVALPSDARSTGFHDDGRAIWVIDDPSVIYLVTATRVEQWPRAADPTLGCM